MTSPAPLAQMPGHLIRRLNQHSTAVFQARLREIGQDITSVQFSALATLAEQPDLDQATLAARIAYDRATIGGVVKRLEQKGLIKRAPSEMDRRAFRLAVTPEGQAVLAKLTPVVTALQNDILASLTPEEGEIFIRLMQKALHLDPLDAQFLED